MNDIFAQKYCQEFLKIHIGLDLNLYFVQLMEHSNKVCNPEYHPQGFLAKVSLQDCHMIVYGATSD